jgi:hypothetical protein
MTHPRVEIAAGLVGSWRGDGHGMTPRPFDFADSWEIVDLGKPFLWFVEKTSRDGAPAHTESGYLRFVDDDGGLEIVAALATGQVELGTGLACTDGHDMVVTTDAEAQNTGTAKAVSRIVRRFRLSGDVLTYEMDMAWSGGPYERHLASTLRRA